MSDTEPMAWWPVAVGTTVDVADDEINDPERIVGRLQDEEIRRELTGRG